MHSTSLAELADEHVALARSSSSGRSAHTIHGGREHVLRQTLLALVGGAIMHDHDSPDEATLQVLRGEVEVVTTTESCRLAAGDYLVIPPQRHGLTALTDAVVVLTVAVRLHA